MTPTSLHCSSVNVSVQRIGGSFGGKVSRSHMVSSAVAVAAWKTHKPVKVALDLKTHMTLLGGREPYYSKYKVGVKCGMTKLNNSVSNTQHLT